MIVCRSILMWVSVLGAGVLAAAGVAVWCHAQGYFPGRRLLFAYRRLPWPVQAFLTVFVFRFVLFGGGKTNQTDNVEGGTTNAPMMTAGVASGVAAPGVGHARYGVVQTAAGAAWGERGAWDDDFFFSFADGWVFPFGTNHLGGVLVHSQGNLASSSYDMAFASLPFAASMVPGESSFVSERTVSNSYAFVWTNVRPVRTAEETVDARIELFRNGDISVSTNGVSTFTPREIPFPHIGIGQNDEWVRTNFVNAAEILAVGYANWVNEQVGVALENGLYKFTATFPDDPLEATLLTVGDLSVVVTNAGEYVFLLEKGVEYAFNTTPYDATVECSMQDDVGPVAPIFTSWWWGGDTPGEWTVDGGWHEIYPPTLFGYGTCLWMPTLRGSPDVNHLGPNDFPMTFTALLTDFCRTNDVTYHWSSGNDNIHIVSPYAQSTEVQANALPSWDQFSMSVDAYIGNETLTSTILTTYGTNDAPQTYMQLNVPKVVVRREDKVDCQKLRPLSVSFSSDVETNGLLRLRCVSGNQKIKLWADTGRMQQLVGTQQRSVLDSKSCAIDAYIEGVLESGACDDIEFVADFIPDSGLVMSVSNKMTVASVVHEALSMTPANRERDELGVGEEVVFCIYPKGVLGQISASSGAIGDSLYGHKSFTAPGTGTVSTVTLDIGDLQGRVDFFVFEPMGYRVEGIVADFADRAGESGLIRLDFDNRITPEEVSFYAIEVMEIPMVATNAVGYFAAPERSDDLDHGNRGAGRWGGVGNNNCSSDIVQAGYYEKPWNGGGSYTWPIPNAWRLVGDEATTNVFSQYDQRFELEADGTARVYKFGYMGERTTNNQHRVVQMEMP